MNVHCKVFYLSNRYILQYAAFFIHDGASRLAISEDNASDDSGNDWGAVWRIVSTGMSEMFIVETDGPEIDLHWIEFTPDWRIIHGFLRCIFCFGSGGVVCVDITLYSWMSDKDVVWSPKSCLFALIHFYRTRIGCQESKDRNLQLICRLGFTLHTFLYNREFLSPILQQLWLHHVWRLDEKCNIGFWFCFDPIGRILLQKDVHCFRAAREVFCFTSREPAVHLVCAFRTKPWF